MTKDDLKIVLSSMKSAMESERDTKMTDQGTCNWCESPDGYWATSCGIVELTTNGNPRDNGEVLCRYCGGRYIEEPHGEYQE